MMQCQRILISREARAQANTHTGLLFPSRLLLLQSEIIGFDLYYYYEPSPSDPDLRLGYSPYMVRLDYGSLTLKRIV